MVVICPYCKKKYKKAGFWLDNHLMFKHQKFFSTKTLVKDIIIALIVGLSVQGICMNIAQDNFDEMDSIRLNLRIHVDPRELKSIMDDPQYSKMIREIKSEDNITYVLIDPALVNSISLLKPLNDKIKSEIFQDWSLRLFIHDMLFIPDSDLTTETATYVRVVDMPIHNEEFRFEEGIEIFEHPRLRYGGQTQLGRLNFVVSYPINLPPKLNTLQSFNNKYVWVSISKATNVGDLKIDKISINLDNMIINQINYFSFIEGKSNDNLSEQVFEYSDELYRSAWTINYLIPEKYFT